MEPSKINDELSTAVHDAESASWSIRAAAGQRLAAEAEVPGLANILQRLLLDFGDTFVTQATAEALLQRKDSHGLSLVLAAFARSKEPSFPETSTMDQLYSAIMGDPRWMTASGENELLSQLEELTLDADESVRGEADNLLNPAP